MTPERREKRRAQHKAWEDRNREHVRAKQRALAKAQPEKKLAAQAKYRAANKEKLNAYNREWRQKNPSIMASYVMKRNAAKRLACPAWADTGAIKKIYGQAAALTKETGIRHDVDHIVPLNSPVVCGLHVSWNLRPVPKVANCAKGNKLLETTQ